VAKRRMRVRLAAAVSLLATMAACGGTGAGLPAGPSGSPEFARPSTWSYCFEGATANKEMRYTLRVARFDGHEVDGIFAVKPYRDVNFTFGRAYVLPAKAMSMEPLGASDVKAPLPYRSVKTGQWDLVVEVTLINSRRAAGVFGGVVTYSSRGVRRSATVHNWAFILYPGPTPAYDVGLCHALIHAPMSDVGKQFDAFREPAGTPTQPVVAA